MIGWSREKKRNRNAIFKSERLEHTSCHRRNARRRRRRNTTDPTATRGLRFPELALSAAVVPQNVQKHLHFSRVSCNL